MGMLILIIIIVIMFLVPFLWAAWQFNHARDGYETPDGFYAGKRPLK